MIKNELFDNVENMKKRLVHKQLLGSNPTKLTKQDCNKNKFVHEENDTMIDKIIQPITQETQTGFEQKELASDDDVCDNVGLTCNNFKEPNSISTSLKHVAYDKDSMKELYDFVFDDDVQEDKLEKQFNTQSSLPQEKNEIDEHHEMKSQTMKVDENMTCNFEVIGVIDDDMDDVVGVDYLSQNAFGKTI